MATETRHRLSHEDRQNIWIVLAVLVLALGAYFAYAAYRGGNYSLMNNEPAAQNTAPATTE